MKTSRVLLLALVAVVCHTGAAHAQSQGRVVVDASIIWRTDASIPIGGVTVGTILDLTARSDAWYEVIVPRALGGRGERGLIARRQVQLLPGSVEPPERALRGSAAAAPAQPRRGATQSQARATRRRPRPPLPGFLAVNGMYRTTTSDFQESATFRANAEDGEFTTAYSVKGGPSFDVSVGGLITPRFGIGAALTRFSRSTPTLLTGSIPHPFFFNRPRVVTGDVGGLTRTELAAHAQARYVLPVNARVRVMAFGGPSFFRLSQGVVTDFTWTDSYPYDEATFQAARTSGGSKWGFGFNAGGDATFFITRQVGVGFTVMVTRASLALTTANDRTVDVDTGGVQAGGGFRLRF